MWCDCIQRIMNMVACHHSYPIKLAQIFFFTQNLSFVVAFNERKRQSLVSTWGHDEINKLKKKNSNRDSIEES